MESYEGVTKATTEAISSERLVLLERNLRQETEDVLRRSGWPVREIVNLWSAGDSDYHRDTVLFITTAGIPMTVLLGVDHQDRAVIDQIWEGWS